MPSLKSITVGMLWIPNACARAISSSTFTCLMDTIAFDVLIEVTEDTEVLVLPSVSLKRIIQNNPYVELFLYKTATEKF
ncbi:MAG: hypothetical protein MJ050_09180, partial [Phascolarctobacterium sp.]|nr:hypothetical protein [Phascolarctobacterium sp.]